MKTSTARLETEDGVKYMKQLCRHWAHKFPTEFDETHGRIQMPSMLCLLDATRPGLAVTLELAEDADQVHLEEVVAEHLQRFGFQETLAFHWQRTPELAS